MSGNFEGIKKQKFGVEIECTGLTRAAAAKAAQKILGGRLHHFGGSYDAYHVWDSKDRKWQFMSDASIRCTKKDGTPNGEGYVSGTSFAAPWITRKVAFLIYNMGLTREIAKALLIDSAAGWDRRDDVSNSIGYGVVPKHINNILQTPNDEIRFVLTGSSEEYETYNYNIPVPISNDKHPFYARATLCYFPKCKRTQGVDYTSTEMDIHFGRVHETIEGKIEIKPVNDNRQGDVGAIGITENEARRMYRKWDNIKLISDSIKKRRVPKKAYGAGMWGLSIKTKERLKGKRSKGLQFGVVVTLKEMKGVNRIDDFIKLCMMRGWIVNRLDVESRLDIFVRGEEEVSFE